MPKIRFYQRGKYMDDVRKPTLEVQADEEVEVTDRLASIVVDAGKGEYVLDKKVNLKQDNNDDIKKKATKKVIKNDIDKPIVKKEKKKSNPATLDKHMAENG